MNAETILHDRFIYLPRQQSRASRTFFGVITLLAWAIYIYLWLPLTTLALWLLGVRSAYLEVFLLHEPLKPPAMLTQLPLLALACAVVLIVWAEYNRRRFQGKERRFAQADVRLSEMSEAMHTTLALGTALVAAKTATLRMDRGMPMAIDVARPLSRGVPAPAPATDLPAVKAPTADTA